MSESEGARRIAEERGRQMLVENFKPAHDEQYHKDELLHAALCYLQADDDVFLAGFWPFDEYWWKPGTTIRNLTKAGALIAAEIDRRLRAGEQP